MEIHPTHYNVDEGKVVISRTNVAGELINSFVSHFLNPEAATTVQSA